MDSFSFLALAFFILIFVIQFILVFLLYKAIRQSFKKVSDLESLMSVTAERVMSIKERTSVATYKEVIKRLKGGDDLKNIEKELNISSEDLQALQKILVEINR